MTIEQDLQRALRRKAPPADLADRVLARIEPQPTAAARRPTLGAAAGWLAAAAAVAIVAAGATGFYADRQAQLEAERVRQDVLLALQITSETLADVQRRVDATLYDAR